ncbi:hypothetical protein MPSEU_000812500 [Mayamaea pseudoterrestris]|nr:hypothetical protein MPSEU_000812500 [Mayamaea pseudoterrestris]
MKPSRLAFATIAMLSRPFAAAFISQFRRTLSSTPLTEQLTLYRPTAINTRRTMQSSPSQLRAYSSSSSSQNIESIDKTQMEAILNDFEEKGRQASGYCVIDVRSRMEVYQTGKLSPSIPTLPVEWILYDKIFEVDQDDFEDMAKFTKPSLDETLVFTCARGIRSMSACLAASEAGYTKLVNYRGGSYEWFGENE